MTTRRGEAHPSAGFTLIELLVALVVGTMIMALVLTSVDRTIRHEGMLRKRGETMAEMSRLRRLMHRDFTAAAARTLTFESNALRLPTTHALLSPHPLLVDVEWDFSGGTIRRIESVEDMNYENELLIAEHVTSIRAELYDAINRRWLPAATVFSSAAPRFTAVRFELGVGDGEPVTIVERLPVLAGTEEQQ
ncbi:prepilin-type N-terminal cleavage/methylation domain-containing protein [Desulfobaculum xiamenense]|uniref:Prepilin-type N-terminal cleavage/methylation domain-containing protein n=1 Tax=Desulfobaculum xiamenense TaxID=995050 RepID=A0A846QNQ8_9BACT|nr:prepilin-type N-terminal cleavage/methylation domain-containing protein [Desulfobaculum xiamenense]NJB68650.1 prepilin-type N-terminal cleavage/methylation domain-containing protein [Desulfobaculum xiamenense]